jgi:hypothetical protein
MSGGTLSVTQLGAAKVARIARLPTVRHCSVDRIQSYRAACAKILGAKTTSGALLLGTALERWAGRFGDGVLVPSRPPTAAVLPDHSR